MAISTYAELQTACQKCLARTDADIVDRTPEFIHLDEAQFNRYVKQLHQKKQDTSLVTVGSP